MLGERDRGEALVVACDEFARFEFANFGKCAKLDFVLPFEG